MLVYSLMCDGYHPLIFKFNSSEEYMESILHYYNTGDHSKFKDYFLKTYQNMVDYHLKTQEPIEIPNRKIKRSL